jgi:predicted RND superfamily exporter protein
MLVAGLVVIGLGVLMVLAGIVMSIVDWNSGRRGGRRPTGRRRSGAAEDMDALRRLLRELGRHPLGTQFITWGVLLILVGGMLGGASRL